VSVTVKTLLPNGELNLLSPFLFLQEQLKGIIIIGQWLPAAGGDGAWSARTGSGLMLMRGDIFAAWRGGGPVADDRI
jgi:hypothetical protein